jgi:His-Xaa-Ser system radical SAM maturase HxsC
MLQLAGEFAQLDGLAPSVQRQHFRISTNPALPKTLAHEAAFLCQSDAVPPGFALYLAPEGGHAALEGAPAGAAKGVLPASADYLCDGDILRVSSTAKSYRVVFRRHSRHQSILLTERCNHYCLMCSQPPRDEQDDWLIEETERLIPLLPQDTVELGLTGGEPTVYGERLINLLRLTDRLLPYTSVHLLSNGRRFADRKFAEAYAAVQHHDLMVGIPLYSDDPSRHNYVVQAEGAFDETIAGILNLKLLQQRVEIRVVVHAQTIDRLPKLAEFIARNLLFVDHVALMGLEITGFTRGNLKQLWIDPYDYRQILQEAVDILAAYRMPVEVYNHQLCVVTPRVRAFCVQSISDWKNEYLPQCTACDLRAQCGGFFSSQVKYRHSDHIAAQRLSPVRLSAEIAP